MDKEELILAYLQEQGYQAEHIREVSEDDDGWYDIHYQTNQGYSTGIYIEGSDIFSWTLRNCEIKLK